MSQKWIWTDGPASQFKNKYVVTAMKELSHICHDMKRIQNFFATSHKKGSVDGVGGTLKRIAVNEIRSRQSIINGMTDFVAAVRLINRSDMNDIRSGCSA